MVELVGLTTEDIPIKYLLGEDEIAAFPDDDTIFSVTHLHRLMEKKGFIYYDSFVKFDKGEVVEIYSNPLGHGLLVTYRDGAFCEAVDENNLLTLGGLMYDPFAELYDPVSGAWEKYDLRKVVRQYTKNVFDSLLERVKSFIKKKQEVRNRMLA